MTKLLRGNWHPGTCKNASGNLEVPSTSGVKDKQRKVESREFQMVDQRQDVLSRHGRLDDSVRDGRGDDGHVHVGTLAGLMRGDELLQQEADAL